MNQHGTLRHCDEAFRFIERIDDAVTKDLVNMAFVQLVKKAYLQHRDLPRGDLDMLYVVTALAELFSDHDVIARTLKGEKVGAWFDE
jgi:hypothetical protein